MPSLPPVITARLFDNMNFSKVSEPNAGRQARLEAEVRNERRL